MSDIGVASANYSLFSGFWNRKEIQNYKGKYYEIRAGRRFEKIVEDEEKEVSPLGETKGKIVREEKREITVLVYRKGRLEEKPEIREEGILVDLTVPALVLTYGAQSSLG